MNGVAKDVLVLLSVHEPCSARKLAQARCGGTEDYETLQETRTALEGLMANDMVVRDRTALYELSERGRTVVAAPHRQRRTKRK